MRRGRLMTRFHACAQLGLASLKPCSPGYSGPPESSHTNTDTRSAQSETLLLFSSIPLTMDWTPTVYNPPPLAL
ncbi:hypothetical protein IG631_06252 [Alternaria alternata]|nr:hypothetical protein IG631_06252 [Alternaria alternata]